MSSIPFSKPSISFHSGIFHTEISVPFHFTSCPGCRFYIIIIVIVTFYPNGCSQVENTEALDFEKIDSASSSFSTLLLPSSLPLPSSFIKVLPLPQKINRLHLFRFQLPLPLPHPWFRPIETTELRTEKTRPSMYSFMAQEIHGNQETVFDARRSRRPRTSEEDIKCARQAFRRSPKKSICTDARQSELPRLTPNKVLHQSLRLRACKVQMLLTLAKQIKF